MKVVEKTEDDAYWVIRWFTENDGPTYMQPEPARSLGAWHHIDRAQRYATESDAAADLAEVAAFFADYDMGPEPVRAVRVEPGTESAIAASAVAINDARDALDALAISKPPRISDTAWEQAGRILIRMVPDRVAGNNDGDVSMYYFGAPGADGKRERHATITVGDDGAAVLFANRAGEADAAEFDASDAEAVTDVLERVRMFLLTGEF